MGACTAIVGAFGTFPVRFDALEDVKAAAESLHGLTIGGKMIRDQTGLGKTVLLLMNLHFARTIKELDKVRNVLYKIMVLVVPAGVSKLWAEEIVENWKTLHLIISYNDTSLQEAKFKQTFISATALKAYPDQSHWPEQHMHIFDQTDPKVATTILPTSYETHVSRTANSRTSVSAGVSGSPVTL